jgi:hypothetical protein
LFAAEWFAIETNRDCDRWMEMKSLATHPGVCDAGTEIASDVGSIANSPIGLTFHDPPAHSNRPAETFLKGMHTLARGCQAERGLPRVRAPKSASFLKGMHLGTWLRRGS